LAVWHQVKLMRSLPFEYIYDSDGRPVTLYVGAVNALLFGHFVAEIVGTHRAWAKT
jgi:hypothetical protein